MVFYCVKDRPWVFGHLLQLQRRLGRENFPLIEQTYYHNYTDMVSPFTFFYLNLPLKYHGLHVLLWSTACRIVNFLSERYGFLLSLLLKPFIRFQTKCRLLSSFVPYILSIDIAPTLWRSANFCRPGPNLISLPRNFCNSTKKSVRHLWNSFLNWNAIFRTSLIQSVFL